MLCLEGEALAKRLLVKFAVRLVLRRVGFVGALRLRFGAAWPRRSLSGWGAMAMSNPWDVPPIPVFGDEDKDETFIGVGMVMSRWESIEMILSVIYSVFALRPGDVETIKEYGEPRMFQERLYGLRRAPPMNFSHSPPTRSCTLPSRGLRRASPALPDAGMRWRTASLRRSSSTIFIRSGRNSSGPGPTIGL